MLNRLVNGVFSQQGDGAATETRARQTAAQHAVHLSGCRDQRIEFLGRDLVIVAQRIVALVHQSSESLKVTFLECHRGVQGPLNFCDHVSGSFNDMIGRLS